MKFTEKFRSLSWLVFIGIFSCTLTIGCGGAGGTEGDANDPAATGDDDAQMQDETGSFQEGAPAEGDGAGAV